MNEWMELKESKVLFFSFDWRLVHRTAPLICCIGPVKRKTKYFCKIFGHFGESHILTQTWAKYGPRPYPARCVSPARMRRVINYSIASTSSKAVNIGIVLSGGEPLYCTWTASPRLASHRHDSGPLCGPLFKIIARPSSNVTKQKVTNTNLLRSSGYCTKTEKRD